MPHDTPNKRSPLNWATSSIVPQSVLQGLQGAIDNPTLDRQPWEAQLQGFGAGALEGLAGLLTPANIATAALPLGMAGRGGGSAASAVTPAFNKAIRKIGSAQRSPRLYEVNDLINKLQQRLQQVPKGPGPREF
jgi:hypothetical protein